MDTLNMSDLEVIWPIIILIGGIFILAYVVVALSLMKIAQKTKTENEWLAWIPFANFFLMTNIAKLHYGYAIAVIVLSFVPIISILTVFLSVFIWWKIIERLNKPEILSLLIFIPVANLGLMLYLAFSRDVQMKKKTEDKKPKQHRHVGSKRK